MRLTSVRCLAVVLCLVGASPVVRAQSLGDVAAKAKAAREAACQADPSTCPKAPVAPTVLTNKDLPAASVTAPPAPIADEGAAPVIVPSTSSPAAVATPGPTTAQLADLDRTKARTALREAQQALRDGERTQREVQHTYENTCLGELATVPLMRACADMRYELRSRVPAALSDIRAEIRRLAGLLNLDPDAAVR